ncbi:MAG TPA: oligopeptide:H+ symporter [Steroidobacteraceae bacterium]|jgi:POT family proton-dependent oligopeptide transporter|nr:oligopeptide:H+ symporter [Steroidobacteraceae bacterium]
MVTDTAATKRHPNRAFMVLFCIEIWERFGYYGMASLLVLYMVQQRGFSDARSYAVWGAFSALVYAMPMLGGYLGDHVLGLRRTMVLGATTLALGYLLLSIPMDAALFPAMGLIALGNGLFKVNPNNLVSRLHEGEHSKLDVLFTVYYMSLQLGAFVSILLLPWIKDHPQWLITLGPLRFDSWHLAFGVSAIGLTLGLVNYGVFRDYLRPYGAEPDFKPLKLGTLAAVIVISLAIAALLSEVIGYSAAALAVVGLLAALLIYVFVRLLATGGREARNGVIACIVFTLISIIWAVYNQQIYTSLTLFALRNVRHSLLGLHVAAAQFQDLNQFWLAVLSLPLAWLYARRGRTSRGDFSIAAKFTVGLYLLAVAFFLYAAGSLTARGGVTSPGWLVAGYFAQSLGELLISALSFSMISQLVARRSRGIIMGGWFLGMGLSNYAGGAIAGLASIPPGMTSAVQTLPIYTRLFVWLGVGALIAAIVVTLLVPWLNRLAAVPAKEGLPDPAAAPLGAA